jgi:hypothetical protein
VLVDVRRLLAAGTAELDGRTGSAARSFLDALANGHGLVNVATGVVTFTHAELGAYAGRCAKTIQRAIPILLAAGVLVDYRAGYVLRGERVPSRARLDQTAIRCLVNAGRARKDAILAGKRAAAAARTAGLTLISRVGRTVAPSQRVLDTRSTPPLQGGLVGATGAPDTGPPVDHAAWLALCLAQRRPTKRPGVGVGS